MSKPARPLRNNLFKPSKRSRALFVFRQRRAEGMRPWFAYLSAAVACGHTPGVRRNAASLLRGLTA